jgi:hypothetical protein
MGFGWRADEYNGSARLQATASARTTVRGLFFLLMFRASFLIISRFFITADHRSLTMIINEIRCKRLYDARTNIA